MQSPELFNRYIDDLATLLHNEGFDIYYYADDLALTCCGFLRLGKAIKIIEQWCLLNEMQMNRQKCGILSLSQTRVSIKQWETDLKEIEGIPLVPQYKYLGATISKNISGSVSIDILQGKIASFCKMVFILRKQGAPSSIIQMLWKVFPGQILYYAGFLSLPQFSSAQQLAVFDRLYKKSLKQTFGLSKTTSDHALFSHLIVPTAKQFLQISLAGVATRTLERYSPHLSQTTTRQLLQLLADIGEDLGYDVTAPSHELKLKDAISNILQSYPTAPTCPLSWTGVRSQAGLTTLKLAVSIDRRSRLTTCPFCRANHPTSGRFFNCLSLPQELRQILNRINQFCDDYADGCEPISIVRSPSILTLRSPQPLASLRNLASMFSHFYFQVQIISPQPQ